VSGEKPRQIALRVLKDRQAGKFIEELLDAALSGARLLPADRHLCQELVYGTVRWQATLDWLISRKTQGRAQKPALQSLLRLGLYQIFWLDRIPEHAAVNETVELARQNGFDTQAGFINAVLRNYLREKEETRRLLAEVKTRQPHVGYSHPEWLVANWQKRWGAEQTACLMEWNNTPPRTFARVNTLKIEPGKLLEQWRVEDVEYDFVRRDWLEENLVFELRSHPPLSNLPSFQAGYFYIQDPSTLLAVRELNPQAGDTVLDLCAAPGGKLTYIAQLMRNEGSITAHDVSKARLDLLNENCKRLGVTCVESALPPTLHAPRSTLFNRILLDAPCSNTGVMRRRVDLRWRLRPEEIQRLKTAQLQLLRQAAQLLKPGGTLVYSTCSLEREENQDVLAQLLTEAPNFKLVRERELLPFSDATDGTYVATLSAMDLET
jgi:16S rRNA (cytosine967-C5)-methyltransferase